MIRGVFNITYLERASDPNNEYEQPIETYRIGEI